MRPSVVKSIPGTRAIRLWSVDAVRMSVTRPAMPNWSAIMLGGMFDTVPKSIEDGLLLYRSLFYHLLQKNSATIIVVDDSFSR